MSGYLETGGGNVHSEPGDGRTHCWWTPEHGSYNFYEQFYEA